MENVKISKVCGLCAGCKFAIDESLKQLEKTNNVVLFKEVVHNKNVNHMLESKGIKIETDFENLNPDSVVVLRAHGEPKSTLEALSEKQIPFVDCTCVNVKKIHDEVALHSKNGELVAIIGKHGKKSGVIHPEIAGTIGWCESTPILIEDEEDVKQFEKIFNTKIYLVCQTTFNMEKADKFIEQIEQITSDNNCKLVVNKSICLAQKQINVFSAELAKECDAMIVVGGKNSSNTTELFNNVKNITPSVFIEDINTWHDALIEANITLSKNTKIGLTAGASTMKSELEELKQMIENKIKEI